MGLIQIIVCFDSQTSGISMMVGIMIFSIVGDLDSGHSLCHRCWKLL